MYIWSVLLFLFSGNPALRQLPAEKGTVCVCIGMMEREKGTVQCTIYDDQQVPVRMIPLQGGHKNGVYTLQLQSLPAGKYEIGRAHV